MYAKNHRSIGCQMRNEKLQIGHHEHLSNILTKRQSDSVRRCEKNVLDIV